MLSVSRHAVYHFDDENAYLDTGILAAAVSGASGGVLTGFAAVGIDPQHFNLQAGIGSTMRIALAAAVIPNSARES
jgi:hypothetical protein